MDGRCRGVHVLWLTEVGSLQVVYMIGWAPHASQQKPLPRGSADHSLKDMQDFLTMHEAGTGSSDKP